MVTPLPASGVLAELTGRVPEARADEGHAPGPLRSGQVLLHPDLHPEACSGAPLPLSWPSPQAELAPALLLRPGRPQRLRAGGFFISHPQKPQCTRCHLCFCGQSPRKVTHGERPQCSVEGIGTGRNDVSGPPLCSGIPSPRGGMGTGPSPERAQRPHGFGEGWGALGKAPAVL